MMSTTEHSNEHYKKLKFEHTKGIDPNGKKKYFAICKICGTHLKNTSIVRLAAHRKSCNGIKKTEDKTPYDIIPNSGKITVGRHLGQYYAKLGFKSAKLKKENGQVANVAICLVCNTDLRNTAWKRLRTHRNKCFSEKYDPLKQSDAEESVDENSLDEAGAEQLQKNLPAECSTSEHAPILNGNKSKVGRKEGKYYKLLGYVPTTVVNKYGKQKTLATCLVCHKKLSNTSAERLYVHRKSCKSEKYKVELVEEHLVLDVENPETTVKIEACDEENSFDDQLQTYNPQNVSDSSSTINDISNVKEAIADFVFGCSLPLNITESSQFQRLIKILNPSYQTEIPGSNELLNSLLLNNYENYLEEARQLWNLEESPMVVGKLKCKNERTFLVSMLQDAVRGTVVFVHCIELKNCLDEATVFKQMIKDSVTLAKRLYDTNVYAIVTDQIINDCHEVWYVNCQRHLAETLLKEFLNTIKYKTCLFKVNCIIDALKDHKFEEKLLKKERKLLGRSHLGSDVDNLYFLIDNWDNLHNSLNANVVLKQKRDIILAFLDLKFKSTCYSCAEQINLLNHFVKKLSLPNCSLADSVILWQNFLKNPIVRSSNTLLVLVEEKHLETKNQYCLVAHYFGEGRASDFSDTEQDAIKRFLAQVLSEEGHEEYDIFENCDHPGVVSRDDLYKSSDFWEMMKNEMPHLSEVALRMLRIPASSGIITEIFSDFSINDPVSREECSNLMAVYFHSKLDGKC